MCGFTSVCGGICFDIVPAQDIQDGTGKLVVPQQPVFSECSGAVSFGSPQDGLFAGAQDDSSSWGGYAFSPLVSSQFVTQNIQNSKAGHAMAPIAG